MSITDGVAENATACTGTEVAANVAADALADRFHVDTYRNGECDVQGGKVRVELHKTNDNLWTVRAIRMPTPLIGESELRLTKAAAIELRDALDVLIRSTAKNGEE